MFNLFKHVFPVLLSFLDSSATKCLFLSDETWVVRLTLIYLNPVELKYYPFTISLDKCTRSFNASPPNIYVPKETKGINFNSFDMITNEDEAKTMTRHISCDCKCKFNSATCNSHQKWNNKTSS